MNHTTQALGVIGINKIKIAGRFFVNNTSAIDNTKNIGKGWTVAHTSTGLYTITLSNHYIQIDSCIAMLHLATAAAQFVQGGGVTPSTNTIVLRVVNAAGSVADTEANAGNYISWNAIVSASSLV